MLKSSKVLGVIALSSVLALTACNSNSSNTNTSNVATQSNDAASTNTSNSSNANNSSSNNAIQDGTAKMLEQVKQLQDAIGKQDSGGVKTIGKTINDTWLSYENSVRQTFPLEYTDVEKYEMPIFSASAYDKIDFEALDSTAKSLINALTTLQQAKPSSASSSELLTEAVKKYEQYVVDQTNKLTAQTQLFVDAVKAGDIDKAKAEYVKARVYYESIEPIAESFGELDPLIDARLADVDDPNTWTGFHEIEKALWVDKSLTGQEKYADQLIKDVKSLDQEVKGLKLDPKTVVAGAMELLNEAATSKITGEEELYSHIDLVDLASNVDGSKTVYLSIIPALNEKNNDLADKLDQAFQSMEKLLSGYVKEGQYVLYTDLTTDQIREISDQLSTLSELMSQTAAIL
ncbi:iron uptake system protein EfeO [Paenibacillus albus]|uniref:Efem/EfeO family lipoprotein n=1 Tax=Paenibacillus albus TaxID=2495582 RepID=A0A3Q8X691_9BACL|nr:iron uptake system protein EfeO [Paenibacillus albus]AZN41117.1 Efem/EfeO family lipoprotein [Paenibacillus albus]